MSDLAEFYLNPKTFLEENLLVMDTSPVGVCPSKVGVLANFFIAKDKRFDDDENILKVSFTTGSHQQVVPAFWLPFEANKTCITTLPSDVPFMFTAPMSGCTFAYSAYPNGTARVAHANYQTWRGRIDHSKILRKVSGFANSIHRESYRTTVKGVTAAPEREAGLLMTVVGVNTPLTGWKFYGQKFELDLMNATIDYHELAEL